MRPACEKNDARGETVEPREVVRDEDDGLVEAASEVAEFALKFGARDRIERAEGLVHQKNGRIGREGAGDANALALAAGKLVRAAGRQIRGIETDEAAGVLRRGVAMRAGSHFSSVGNEADIFGDGEMGKETAFLNDVADAAAEARWGPIR